ncbi:hypothetical protein SLS56_009846 [Neofusicoccum ribis]|uniref:PNPLA domain-containing protein n=1 Tax=Neofusicoccum ribis TaxID=45134 RepID=A0ABR3SGN9_9PEZI
MANGRYDVTVLEHYLKRVYGRRQRLFDSDRAGSSGIKIAVTGFIFPPKYITALDCHLQDGGIGEFNNPIDAAKWEARLIWPAALEPDFVVSTGTGYATGPGTSTWLPPCLSRTFLNGICKSIEFSSESEMTFKRHMQGESERHNKFRLTLPLADVPALDDAQRIPELREKAHTQAETDSEIQTIVQAMLCTQFFLELDALPIYSFGLEKNIPSLRLSKTEIPYLVRLRS